MSKCSFKCLSASVSQKTTGPNFTILSAHVAVTRSSHTALRYIEHTFSFEDAAMFVYNVHMLQMTHQRPAPTAKSDVYDCPVHVVRSVISGGSTLGRGHRPLQSVARPPDLAVLLTHCGQLILRKINKSDANRCQILRLK